MIRPTDKRKGVKYVCCVCGIGFYSGNAGAKYCSIACKQDSSSGNRQADVIRSLYEAGNSQSVIAQQLGLSRTCVYAVMKRHGISARSEVERFPARMPPNPCGFCQCGCGARTAIAKKTSTHHGTVKGEHLRFVPKHHARKHPATYSVDEQSQCWVWNGAIQSNGYGRYSRGESAHRWSFRMHRGAIPDGQHVHHRCGVKRCINPEHLELIDAKEHPRLHGKMTPLIVSVIRCRNREGIDVKDISAEVGFPVRHIKKVINGVIWEGVEDEQAA